MAKTKIVEIIADSQMGGGTNHVLALLSNIDQERFDCWLICPSGYLSRAAKELGHIQIFTLPMASKYDFKSLSKLKKKLAEIESAGDPFGKIILHAHGPRAGLFTALSARSNMKKVYTEHLWDDNFHLGNPLNEYFQKKILKYICRKFDKIIAVSSSVRNFLVQNNFGTKDKIKVIHNGINLDEKIPLHPIKAGNCSPIIGTVGSLNKQKGHKYLLEAMPKLLSQFPLLRLEIVGEGPEEINLKQEVKRLKIEKHVRFLGQKRDINKYLANWDVFVLPSVAETFGIVLLEAMQAGVPIVASKVGGVSDIIQDGENGLLAKVAKPDTIAKAVINILTHPVLAAKLKREGLKTLPQFDWQKIIKEIENLYLEISGS